MTEKGMFCGINKPKDSATMTDFKKHTKKEEKNDKRRTEV